jgi:hypothetical protein
MMPIVRHERGATAPRDARYALVGHYGESAGFTVWCEAGEALPFREGEAEVAPPLWYVEVVPVQVKALAA